VYSPTSKVFHGPLDRGMVLLQLCHCLHKETLQHTIFDRNLILLTKTTNLLIRPTIWGTILGLTYAFLLWLIGKPVVDICDNWTFFASSYVSDIISGNRLSRFSKGVGHFKCKYWVEGDIAHQPLLVSENQNDCPCVASKYQQYVLSFCNKAHVWWTDTDEDGQNYDSQALLHCMVKIDHNNRRIMFFSGSLCNELMV